jgi:putative transposase
MARQLRVEFPGAIYHVSCRMVGSWQDDHSLLFKDEADCDRFLDQLSERVGQYHIRLYLFVCMTNHFHLVFETPEGNCSKFMQSLCTAYTVYYNLRHRRHGHLFDGRFKAKLVEGDPSSPRLRTASDYLLALSRYVHLNPVQVADWKNKPIKERIKALRAHRWSSYPSYIGRRKALDFVEYGPLLAQMGGKRSEWPKRYREFVEGGLAESDEDFEVALKLSPRSIGGDGFRVWIDEMYQKRIESHARPEDVSFRHVGESLPPDKVLHILSEIFDVEIAEFSRRRHNSPLRAVAASQLIRYAGLSQREVAQLLNIGSGSAVCKQLSALPAKLVANRRLRRQVKQAHQRLDEMRRG